MLDDFLVSILKKIFHLLIKVLWVENSWLELLVIRLFKIIYFVKKILTINLTIVILKFSPVQIFLEIKKKSKMFLNSLKNSPYLNMLFFSHTKFCSSALCVIIIFMFHIFFVVKKLFKHFFFSTHRQKKKINIFSLFATPR